MKKFYYLIAMAIMAFTFTSCEDVPAPFGQPVHISGDTEDDPSGGDDSGLAVNEDFKAAGKLTWSVTNVVAPDGIDVWQYDSRYGLKATAYAGGANNAAESWLICPEPYNFSNVSGAKMTIKHAANYFSDGAEKECKVLASTDYSKSVADATWTEIKIDTWPTSWDFVEGTGDMSAFDGKDKVYIAFKYTSTATKSGTWEIESLKVEGGGSSSGGGETGGETGAAKGTGTQSDPFNIAAAIAKCKEVGTTASTEKYYIKGIVVKGGTVSGGYGNVTFDMGDTKESTDLFKAYQVAGTNGEKLADGYEVKVGDEVVIYGPVVTYNTTYETSGKSAAQIVTINGKGTDGSGGDTGGDTGAAKGTGTQADPFNIAAAIAKCKEVGTTASTEKYYIKGIVVKGGTVSGGYGNVTFDMGDTKESTDLFKAYQVAGTDGEKLADGYEVKAGDEVVIYGPVVTYNTTYETSGKSAAQIVTINGKKTNESSGGESGGGDTGGGSSTPTSLTNGDFETWASGQPTGWKSASSASSATLEQSTDAHGGSYAVIVKGGGTANKRLASQEISLTAGSYNFSFWVKATTANKAQCCAGYVPVTNGTAGSYQYKKNGTSTAYETLSTTWSQVSYDFTLDADATICLVVMNPKSSSYSSGEDILVDDATLTKK